MSKKLLGEILAIMEEIWIDVLPIDTAIKCSQVIGKLKELRKFSRPSKGKGR